MENAAVLTLLLHAFTSNASLTELILASYFNGFFVLFEACFVFVLCSTAQADLKLNAIFLHFLPKCGDYRPESPSPAFLRGFLAMLSHTCQLILTATTARKCPSCFTAEVGNMGRPSSSRWHLWEGSGDAPDQWLAPFSAGETFGDLVIPTTSSQARQTHHWGSSLGCLFPKHQNIAT